jgi:hypothetical protein
MSATVIPFARPAPNYDRRAIMRRALADARQQRATGSPLSWRFLIQAELRRAWLREKLRASVLILTRGRSAASRHPPLNRASRGKDG